MQSIRFHTKTTTTEIFREVYVSDNLYTGPCKAALGDRVGNFHGKLFFHLQGQTFTLRADVLSFRVHAVISFDCCYCLGIDWRRLLNRQWPAFQYIDGFTRSWLANMIHCRLKGECIVLWLRFCKKCYSLFIDWSALKICFTFLFFLVFLSSTVFLHLFIAILSSRVSPFHLSLIHTGEQSK